MTKTTLAEEKNRDPIPRFEDWLIDRQILSRRRIRSICAQSHFEAIEKAAARRRPNSLSQPAPAQPKKYFKPFEAPASHLAHPGESIVMMDALNHALIEEMERDPGVVVFGQDVAHGKGGVFGITRTLTDRFGKSGASIPLLPNRPSSRLRSAFLSTASISLSPRSNSPTIPGPG